MLAFDLVDEAEFFGSDWLEQAASAQGAFVAGQLHKRQARLRRKSQVARGVNDGVGSTLVLANRNSGPKFQSWRLSMESERPIQPQTGRHYHPRSCESECPT